MRRIGVGAFASLFGANKSRARYSIDGPLPPLLAIAPYLTDEKFSEQANKWACEYRECNQEVMQLLRSEKLLCSVHRVIELMDRRRNICREAERAGMSESQVDYLIRVAESGMDIERVFPYPYTESEYRNT